MCRSGGHRLFVQVAANNIFRVLLIRAPDKALGLANVRVLHSFRVGTPRALGSYS